MAGSDPFELPGLAAHRRGPSAAVCTSGHVFRWLVDPGFAASHCPKCGDQVLVACPACSAPLPGDAEMLQWVPYDGNCADCGEAYPWKAAHIGRAKRTLAEQAELEGWTDAVKARANEVIDDIAADRASASEVVTALKWLASQGAESATATVLDAVDGLAGMPLKQALRPHYPGLF
jgi:hypothetical protein